MRSEYNVPVVILALSVDFELIRVLSALLRGDGCSVAGCAGVEQARELPEPFELVAMVVDGGAVPEALTLVHELRASGSLKPAAPVIFLADDKQRAGDIAAVGAHLLLNPPSLLDLADHLRTALPPPGVASDAVETVIEDEDESMIYFLPSPEAEPSEPPSQPSRSGGTTLHAGSTELRGGPARSSAEQPPRDGGAPEGRAERPSARPAARRTWNMGNARALTRWWFRKATGVLRVEGPTSSAWVLIARGGPVGPDGVAAVEDALSGGEVSLDPCDVDEVGDRGALARLVWRAAREAVGAENVLSLIPVANGLSEGASELPLTPASRRCLGRFGGGVTVQTLARREGAPVADVAVDLAALRWLGLIALREPEIEAESDPPSRTHGSRPEPAGDADTRRTRTVQRPAAVERPFARDDQRDSVVDPPTVPGAARRERADDPVTISTSSLMPLGRLRREVEILRTADAWTVLGLPRRSPLDMVQAAAARMRQRYEVMDKNASAEALTLAAEIVRQIDAAERELLSGNAGRTEPVYETTIRHGVAALRARDWSRAHRCFVSARQQMPDSPVAHAYLGWARFNDPALDRAAREEDGAALVELALQFDNNCAIAWFVRGDMLNARGQAGEARQSYSTAIKLDPTLLARAPR